MAQSSAKSGDWKVVSDESPTKVVFDAIGDTFTGTFVRAEILKNREEEDYTMWLFHGTGEFDATVLYGIPDSYKIRKGLESVTSGQEVRIEYVKNVEVGRPQPMKDFRISVR